MADQRKNNHTSPTVLIDSDAFVAFVKKDDVHHEHVANIFSALAQQQAIIVTSNYVFAESITVISRKVGHSIALDFIQNMKTSTQNITTTFIDADIEHRAIEIFTNQTSKNVSFVDCTNMAIIDTHNLDAIFSFDAIYQKNGYKLAEDIV